MWPGMQIVLGLHCVYGVITTQMPDGYIDTRRDASRTKRAAGLFGPPITCIMSCSSILEIILCYSSSSTICIVAATPFNQG